MLEQALPGTPCKTVERQGWRDRALQGRIHGRVLQGVPGRAKPHKQQAT